jgi:acyl carrier protein
VNAVELNDAGKAAARHVADWLCAYLGKLFDLEAWSIDPDQSFARFGLDSVATVAMIADLSEWLGFEIDLEVVFDSPSVVALSQVLAMRADVQQALRIRQAQSCA